MNTELQNILETAANFARLAAESTTAAERCKFSKLASEWTNRAAKQSNIDNLKAEREAVMSVRGLTPKQIGRVVEVVAALELRIAAAEAAK
jgi:hypothetical protein